MPPRKRSRHGEAAKQEDVLSPPPQQQLGGSDEEPVPQSALRRPRRGKASNKFALVQALCGLHRLLVLLLSHPGLAI